MYYDFARGGREPVRLTWYDGTTAVRAGRVLNYDAVNMRFPDDPDADRLLGREYREGWEL